MSNSKIRINTQQHTTNYKPNNTINRKQNNSIHNHTPITSTQNTKQHKSKQIHQHNQYQLKVNRKPNQRAKQQKTAKHKHTNNTTKFTATPIPNIIINQIKLNKPKQT